MNLTVHDLAASWEPWEEFGIVAFRLEGGRAEYEHAQYCEGGHYERVRIGRLLPTKDGIRQIVRWVNPDTRVTIITKPGYGLSYPDSHGAALDRCRGCEDAQGERQHASARDR